jgi:glutamate 5-kinase
MASKVCAAAEAARFGAATIILHGTKEGSLIDAIGGNPTGTFFFPHDNRISSKLHWIEFSLKSRGMIHVDAGARDALLKRGKSLLASGITHVDGEFESGEAVEISCKDVGVFAKGLSNYHSFEMQQIKGRKSTEIEGILGYKVYDEVMHRDDIVFFQKSKTTDP